MRRTLALALLLAGAAIAADEGQPPKRFGIAADLKAYPQDTPKEALASVVKAIEAKQIDYLLAHLADPEFVDERVKDAGGKFEEVVKEAKAKLVDDPAALKQLQRFLKEGEWKIDNASASVAVKEVADRQVYFRKVGGRWFMENRYKAEAKPTGDK